MMHSSVQQLIKVLPGVIARYYGCNFYLVGSSLDKENPRDIDVVVDIPDDLFFAMYGAKDESVNTWIIAVDSWDFVSKIWKNWAIDVAKQGRELTFLCGKQVDFKTQPSSYFQSIDKPRFLINW